MKTFKERLEELKRDNEPAHISYFNDGSVRTDKRGSAKRIETAGDPQEYRAIEGVLLNAAKSYADVFEFDSIDMDLLLGLVFNVSEIQGETINHDPKYIPGIVRYYTGSIRSYDNGMQTNDRDFSRYGFGRQGYIEYDKLVKSVRESGLQFTGPETFKEFEETILTGEPFDITISADLKPQKQSNDAPIKK